MGNSQEKHWTDRQKILERMAIQEGSNSMENDITFDFESKTVMLNSGYNRISYRKVWKNEAAVFEGESWRHLFIYDSIRNIMEAPCGD